MLDFDEMVNLSFGEFEEPGLNYIFLEHIAHVYYEGKERPGLTR